MGGRGLCTSIDVCAPTFVVRSFVCSIVRGLGGEGREGGGRVVTAWSFVCSLEFVWRGWGWGLLCVSGGCCGYLV